MNRTVMAADNEVLPVAPNIIQLANYLQRFSFLVSLINYWEMTAYSRDIRRKAK